MHFALKICSLIFISFFLNSCGPSLAQRDELLTTYHYGNLPDAENRLSNTIQRELPNGDFRCSRDAVWLLLDRATIRFANGETPCAIEDYSKAIEALDYYNQDSPSEILAKTVLDDNVGAYQGAGFEQVLARLYFALALIQEGDLNNATAILRQGEELQQQIRETYSRTPFMCDFILTDNAVEKYLFAAILEKKGDLSNANILYQQAAQLSSQRVLPECAPKNSATVIVLCHNGNVPRKVSDVSDSSVASAIALEFILAAHDIPPACSTLAGIPVPGLYQSLASNPVAASATLDGCREPLRPMYDVASAAYQSLQQDLPIIVARGVARLAIRRTAVAYAQRQDPCLGAIIDIGMLIANATTQADIRAWSTLPSSIDMVRFDVPPGEHTFNFQIEQNRYLNTAPFCEKLNLGPNDLCIINVFQIHPGVTTVLVPPKFLSPIN